MLFTVTNATPTVSCAFASLNGGEVALTVLAAGRGQVTANPRGSQFNHGQTVTLTALPDTGQSFQAWTGDAMGTQTNLVVVLNQSKTCPVLPGPVGRRALKATRGSVNREFTEAAPTE